MTDVAEIAKGRESVFVAAAVFQSRKSGALKVFSRISFLSGEDALGKAVSEAAKWEGEHQLVGYHLSTEGITATLADAEG